MEGEIEMGSIKFSQRYKWVFCSKTNQDGTIHKFKATLVIKGYNQRVSIYYNQTFNPVARMGTAHSLLFITTSEKMKLVQFG